MSLLFISPLFFLTSFPPCLFFFFSLLTPTFLSPTYLSHLCHYCLSTSLPHPHLLYTLSLSPAGHRRNNEHCSERAAWAGAAELSQARPRRGAGHPGAAADLRQQRRGSHAGQLQRVPQPHPRRHAEVHRQHWAAHPPQHQLLQRYHEHLQAYGSAPHGGATQTPRFETQTHGHAQIQPGPTASSYVSSGPSGQVLHHVTSGTETRHEKQDKLSITNFEGGCKMLEMSLLYRTCRIQGAGQEKTTCILR